MIFAVSCKTNPGGNMPERPNILFIFADDWGYGDLGCYGNTEVATPNIDKLALEGTRFTQFHVTSGVCSPSRTSVITGHFPARYMIHGHFAGTGPVFVNLWLKDPHTPLWPSKQQREPYKGMEPDKETYYAVITDADFHIGRLIRALEEIGIDENTLVIFSSDNGPADYPPASTAGSTAGQTLRSGLETGNCWRTKSPSGSNCIT